MCRLNTHIKTSSPGRRSLTAHPSALRGSILGCSATSCLFFATLFSTGSTLSTFASDSDDSGNREFSDPLILAEDAAKPVSVYVVDLDADGDQDLLAASSDDGSLRWLEGSESTEGDQQFTEHLLGNDALGGNSVRTGDLDGDGDLDVVATSRSNDMIFWYEQKGLNDGRFGDAQEIGSSSEGVSFAAVSDIDGDGDEDIVATIYEEDQVVWFSNSGDGSFSDEMIIEDQTDGPWMLQAADLDGDGDQDVLVAFYSADKVAWYANDGSGSFSSSKTLVEDLDGATFVIAADLDNDQDLDVALTAYRDDTIGWIENQGSGEFLDLETLAADADGAADVYAVDLDDDDDLDLVAAVINDDEVVKFENVGEGFTQKSVIDGSVDGPRSIYAGDLDGDGYMDLAVTGSKDHTVVWLENLKEETELPGDVPTAAPVGVSIDYAAGSLIVYWDRLPASSDGGSPIIRYVAVATTDGDGESGTCTVPSLAASCRIRGLTAYQQYQVVVRAENDHGQGPSSEAMFEIPVHTVDGGLDLQDRGIISEDSDAITSVYASDIDDDGDADVFSTSIGDSTVAMYENLGDGTFSDRVVLGDTIGKPYSVRTGDLDADGDLDVVAAALGGNAVIWFPNTGDGSFGDARDLISDVPGASFAMAVDLDGDLDHDVVYTSYEGNYVAYLENLGQGSFASPVHIAEEVGGAWHADVADLDSDGVPDVIVGSGTDDTVQWFRNEGDGTFSEKKILSSTSDRPSAVFAADLDDDGDADVLSASYNDDTVAWFENEGDGSFGDGVTISTESDGVSAVYAGDIDLDGDIDVFAASIHDDTVEWFENLSGSFSESKILIDRADGARSVMLADAEGDGELDVFAGTYYEDSLRWWENDYELPPPASPPKVMPSGVSIEVGDGKLTVMWDLIPEMQGLPITGYVVAADPSNPELESVVCHTDSTVNRCVLEGLTNGESYSITVMAENILGAGPASEPVIETPIGDVDLKGEVSGSLVFETNYKLDGTTNDPNNTANDNNERSEAQVVPVPGNVAGWGDENDDPNDWYEIELDGSLSVAGIYVASHEESFGPAADFDLYLIDSAGEVVEASAGPARLLKWFFIGINEVGTYYLHVNAASDGGNYILIVSPWVDASPTASPPIEQQWSLSGDFVPSQLIMELEPQLQEHESAHSVVTEMIVDGMFTIRAGDPERELLIDVPHPADGSLANEVLIGGEFRRFKTEKQAAKVRTLLAAKKILSHDSVRRVELNHRIYPLLEPDDELYEAQWHYQNLNLPEAWDTTTGSDDVVVAVVDTGYLDHPDLIDRLLRREDGSIAGYDMIIDSDFDGDPGIDPDPFDSVYNDHGTHVAGTIGAETNNSDGVAGVTWNTKIMPVRVVAYGGSLYEMVQGIRYAGGLSNDSGQVPERHAQVINLSLGFNVSPCQPVTQSQFYEETAEELLENGVLLVWAAGNDSCDHVDETKQYEDSVVVVATALDNDRAPYSSWGENVMVATPGGAMGEDLDGDGNADGVLSTGFDSDREPDYHYKQGTSMAAPHAVGTIALMLAANPDLTIHDVLRLIRGIHPDPEAGPVTMDLGEAGRDDVFGHGLFDAHKAVEVSERIAGGTGPIEEPRLGLHSRAAIIPLARDFVEITYYNRGRGGEPLDITGITSGVDWLRGRVSETGIVTVEADRTGHIPGQSATVVAVHSNGGTKSAVVNLLVSDPSETGDIGFLYIDLEEVLPDGSAGSIYQETLDTTDGEVSFSFLDIPLGTYKLFAGTDRDGDGKFCDPGELCAIYPDQRHPGELKVNGDVADADMYLYGQVIFYDPVSVSGSSGSLPIPSREVLGE